MRGHQMQGELSPTELWSVLGEHPSQRMNDMLAERLRFVASEPRRPSRPDAAGRGTRQDRWTRTNEWSAIHLAKWGPVRSGRRTTSWARTPEAEPPLASPFWAASRPADAFTTSGVGPSSQIAREEQS